MRSFAAIIVTGFTFAVILSMINFPCIHNGKFYSNEEIRENALIYEIQRRNRSFPDVPNWDQVVGRSKINIERFGASIILQIVNGDSYAVEFLTADDNSIVSLNACGSVTSRIFVEL